MKLSSSGNIKTTARVLPQRDPEVIEARAGGGCLSLFGLPFFLAGLAVMTEPLGYIPFEGPHDQPWWFYILFGAVFAIVGGILVFGRSGLKLDRRSGTALKWWGLMVPMKTTTHPLSEFNRINIRKEVGDRNSPTTYPVEIAGRDIKKIKVIGPTDYRESRREAEGLARFLNLPLADSSSGKTVVREPDHLDESLADRARRTGEKIERLPDQPPLMKTRIERTGDGVILEIPAQGYGAVQYVQLGAAAIFSVFILSMASTTILDLVNSNAPPLARYGIPLVIVLAAGLGPILGMLLSIRKNVKSTTRVIVTGSFISMETGKGKTVEIPADQIEEVSLPTTRDTLSSMNASASAKNYEIPETGMTRLPDGSPASGVLLSVLKYANSSSIIVRSDATTIQLGQGLDEQELQYLHALIQMTLEGGKGNIE